jgi:spermidine/putrescine transport system substrate-binding protein
MALARHALNGNTLMVHSKVLGVFSSVLLLAIAGLCSLAATAEEHSELVMLNWSEYMDPGILAEFEQIHGVRVREAYFESDDDRDRLVQQTQAKGFDVALVNGNMLEHYVRRGWIAKIDPDQVPNLQHIEGRWANAFEGATEYGVPYFWGVLGFAYRSDLIDRPLRRWMDLFRPAEQLCERIVMMNHSRDLMGMALVALGFSANSTDPKELDAAERLLLEQRPCVKDYYFLALSEKSALVTGEVVAAMMYSGDALMVRNHHEAIVYVIPEEGTNLWVDYLVVMANSPRKALAHRFINFLNEPKRAARLAEFVFYATPNRAAQPFLSDKHRNDPVIHPPQEVLQRSETYTRLPPKAIKRRNLIFHRVTD